MAEAQEIRARVRFLSSEEGGRKGPVVSGYRPPLDFGIRRHDGERVYSDGILVLEDREEVLPGEECLVRIRLLHPELLQNALSQGQEFGVTEGPRRVIGHGTILEILNKE